MSKNNLQEIRRQYTLLMDLMDNVPDVIYFKDRQGRLILVNKAHARGLGLNPKEVVGKTDFDIFSKERAKLMAKDDEYVMKTGKAIIDKVERSTRADGIDNYVSTTKIPRYGKNGKIIGLIGITRDITHRKHFERIQHEMDRAKKELAALERIDKVKSEFISVVSHELRTPIAIMKEAAALILDGIKGQINDGQRDLLLTVQENGERLRTIVEELLDISRIERGTLKLHYSLVNLNDLLFSSADFFKQAAQSKRINLEYHLPQDEVNIFLDPERAHRIVANLIDNAIKFTEEAGRIEVELKVFEDKVRVGVIDTGIGISRDDLPKIFEKFVQVSRLTNTCSKGIGLGLPIVKELVEKHGGEIWAESRLGQGSRFYFTLPRFYTKNSLSKDMRDKINNLLNTTSNLHLVNILIVHYPEFMVLIKDRSRKILDEIRQIINTLPKDFAGSRRAKMELLMNDFQQGEWNMIIPEADDKDVVRLCGWLKDKISGYFARNRLDNVFINIGVWDIPSKTKDILAKDIPVNINIKKIHIGAEKRRFKRITSRFSVEVSCGKGKAQATQSIDISIGGICFIIARRVKTDEVLNVKLQLPQARTPVSLSGRVAWIRELQGVSKYAAQYKVGLEFINLQPKDIKGITRIIKSYG